MEPSASQLSLIPSLLSTAKLAYELTSQEWSQIGGNGTTSELNVLTERILAVMLIRLLAIVNFRSRNNIEHFTLNHGETDGDSADVAEGEGMPQQFLDLSCTTMCRTIIAQSEGFVVKRTICGRTNSADYINSRILKDNGVSTSSGSMNFGLTGSVQGCSKAHISVERISDSFMKEPTWPKVISEEVIQQLRMYIHSTLANYRNVHYHSCEHAYHVFMSANKLLDMMLCSQTWSPRKEDHSPTREKGKDTCDVITEHSPTPKHIRPTYGIKDNPLSQFALLFSALVHDVEHTGVGNRQLVLESDELAILYNDQSVAEQRSLSIAFKVINKEKYKAMRKAMFGDYVDGKEEKYREQYRDFRKVVIDLVLCTDIASPERMQIVKSAYKEAFVDIGTNQKPTKATSDKRLDKGSSFDVSNNIMPISSPAISILLGEGAESVVDDVPLVQKFIEARYSLAAELNMNSKPLRISRNQANLEQISGRNKSCRYASEFGMIVGDSDLSTGDEGDKDDDGQSTGSYLSYSSSIEMESSDELFVRSPSSTSRQCIMHNSLSKLCSTPVMSTTPLNPSIAQPPRAQPATTQPTTTQPATTQPHVQRTKKISFFERVRRKKEKIKALARCSPRFRERGRTKECQQSKVESSSDSSADTKNNSSEKQSFERQESQGSRQTQGSKRVSVPKMTRRNSAPGEILYDRPSRKKFRFRLGIRRALDLSGNTIEAFSKTKNTIKGQDFDQADNLKATVILEQMLKAADVAANMQCWETMLKWTTNLFNEQMACFEAGRGVNPILEWRENQIAFFESYTLPLARRLMESRVLEISDAEKLVKAVQKNILRWTIEGKSEVEKMRRDWYQHKQ